MAEITVVKRDRIVAGSCNACQERINVTVLEVSLKTLGFRLCRACAQELLVRLREALRGGGR